MTFHTPLRVERIEDTSRDGRGTWRLLARLVYVSPLAGRAFVVPEDFITDFASVPRIPIAFLLTGDMAQAAAVVHDWLYTTHEVERAVADDIFYEAAVSLGISRWQAWLMWAGVRIGGGGSWDAPGPQQPVVVQVQIGNPVEAP